MEKKPIVLKQQSNETIQIIGVIVSLIITFSLFDKVWQQFICSLFITLIIDFFKINKTHKILLHSTGLEYGFTQSFFSPFKRLNFIEKDSFEKIEISQNAKRYYDIKIIGQNGEKILLSKNPNKLPAEKEATSYLKTINEAWS